MYAAYVAESGDYDIDLTGPRAFAGANIFAIGLFYLRRRLRRA